MKRHLCFVLGSLWIAGCGDGATTPENTGGSGGQGTSTTTTTETAAGGSGGESTGGMGGSGGTGQGGIGGLGGQGGTGPGWPTCDAAPPDLPVSTLHDVWVENPALATEYWVPEVFVTAVSGGGCVAGTTCQLFVQQKETFASVAEGSQQALRVVVFPDAVEHFLGIALNDQIHLRGHAYRHTSGGENELFFHVSQALPGCHKVVGTGVPVAVTGLVLEDLTVPLYEDTMGPLFIRLETVSGKPKLPDETFGLWESFMPGGGPIEEVTSMSPFFLPGSAFVGFTPDAIHNFTYVDGVFGLFAPPADPLIKYEEIYIRSMDDAPVGGQ